jgi:hypothetical protein
MRSILTLLLLACLPVAGGPAAGRGAEVTAGVMVYVPVVVRSGPPGSNGVVNGDFEDGRTGWIEYEDSPFFDYPLIVHENEMPPAIRPYDGVWAAWLGGDPELTSWIEQEVTLPESGPELVYWHWIDSIWACDGSEGGVLVDETPVDEFELCQATDTGGWVKRTIDLSAFAGETVRLRIWSATGVSDYSSLYIDAVWIDG